MIDILFAGVNFAILVALAGYVYIRYMDPNIRQAIQQEQADHDKLIGQRTQLRETCREIEARIAQQETLYQELYDSIAQWDTTVSKARQKREEMIRKTREHNKKRRYQQQAYRIQRNALQTCVPKAFDEAQRELQSQYAGKAGVRYIDTIIERMEQRHG